MTTALTEPAALSSRSPAQRLRDFAAAMRLGFTWFGVRKTLTQEQREQAAESFGAEGRFMSAGKKLLDTRHPAFKAVTSVRHRISAYWRSVSLPFPEPGIRLIRQEDVHAVDEQLTYLRSLLHEAVSELDSEYLQLKSAAMQRLGRLFNEADYPASLSGLFDAYWEFPTVEPPAYLQQLNPQLYEQECRRIATRFDEAVQLAEQAFTSELSKLVSHLGERLSGTEDGRPKVFRDSALGNLREFFDRFRELNIRSNEQLDRLVEQARQVVGGVQPQQLRDNESLRQRVSAQLAGVQSALEGMLVDKPRRRILRTRPQGEM